LVYNHFSRFDAEVGIEMQQSSNLAIGKLLQNASKKGEGRGYPDFIISLNAYPNTANN